MGQIDVKIVVQLWQIVFSAIVGSGMLLSIGFTAAIVFVRRKEFDELKKSQERMFNEIKTDQKEVFRLIRGIKEDIGTLKAK